MEKITSAGSIMVCAALAMLFSNGCLTTETEVKEPTIKTEPQKIEVVQEDIEVIERNDTTGRVSAAREAARKLLADAKQQSIDLTRDAKNIYELKKVEAEKMAAQMIADARAQAAKEKEALIKSYLEEQKKITAKKADEIIEKSKDTAAKMKDEVQLQVEKILKEKKLQTDKIADKIIQNAQKTAADITKAGLQQTAKAKQDADKVMADANKYFQDKKAEADKYLTQKMAEADKAVTDFVEKMKKEAMKKPETNEEKEAEKMVNSIMGSIPKDDYDTFTANFTTDLKGRFPKDKFMSTNKVLRDKLGDCSKLEYLGFLKKGPLTMYLWKANFKKTSENNEMVIRLTLGELDKKLQVFAFDISMM